MCLCSFFLTTGFFNPPPHLSTYTLMVEAFDLLVVTVPHEVSGFPISTRDAGWWLRTDSRTADPFIIYQGHLLPGPISMHSYPSPWKELLQGFCYCCCWCNDSLSCLLIFLTAGLTDIQQCVWLSANLSYFLGVWTGFLMVTPCLLSCKVFYFKKKLYYL